MGWPSRKVKDLKFFDSSWILSTTRGIYPVFGKITFWFTDLLVILHVKIVLYPICFGGYRILPDGLHFAGVQIVLYTIGYHD